MMSEEERVVIDLKGIMPVGYPIFAIPYPENKPTETGYYLCQHLFESKLYDKCIQWYAKKQEWVGTFEKQNWNVVAFVPQTRADYYTECLDKTLDLYYKTLDLYYKL